MKRRLPRARIWLLAVLFTGAGLATPEARGQTPAPTTDVALEGSEAMFTTMCALQASGFEADVNSAGWYPLRARLRDALLKQQGPAVDGVRQFYKDHVLAEPGATLSRFVWFGLVSGPAPQFKPTQKHEDLPPDVLALEGFDELLANYYREQNIASLWAQVQLPYQKEIARMHDPISQIIYVASAYLGEIRSPMEGRRFSIVVEPMVGKITNVRSFGGQYAIVLSGTENIPLDVVRHAYLHYLLDGLPLRYPHVVALQRPMLDYAARAPRLPAEYKDDFSSFFAECLVRAVELKLRRVSPGEQEAVLRMDDGGGFVLVRPLYGALAGFEKAGPGMSTYFPDLVRSMDLKAEEKRLDGLKFDAVETTATGTDAELAEVSRTRKNLPASVPNDPEAIAALSDGERQLAARNPRAAEAAFQKVLANYPEQPRARYGMGVVAMLEGDGARAKQVFGTLVAGEHAATGDALVLAWSHVYLGRILAGEGEAEMAKQEFEAALAVPGGPEPARQAAQRDLTEFEDRKARHKP